MRTSFAILAVASTALAQGNYVSQIDDGQVRSSASQLFLINR